MYGKKALVILSGGQDSSTTMFWAKEYFEEVHAITFDYGQRHALEIQSARAIALIAGAASHEVLHLPQGVLHGTSPLTDKSAQLETYKDHASMEAIIGDRIEKTFVPMRNALFITLAANRAVCLGATSIVTGVCQEDNANYPDCRQDFIDAQQRTINEALGFMTRHAGDRMAIYTPLMLLTKARSVQLAQSLGTAYPALAFTHTAYDGLYPPVGKDHASVLRAHGFEEAGVPDPLVIRAAREGFMTLPDTSNYKNSQLNTDVGQSIDWLMQQHPALSTLVGATGVRP